MYNTVLTYASARYSIHHREADNPASTKNMTTNKILNLLENTLDDYYIQAAEGQYCISTGSTASTADPVAEMSSYIASDIDEDESDVTVALRELIEDETLSFDVVDWPNPENEQDTVSVLRLFVTGNDGEYDE